MNASLKTLIVASLALTAAAVVTCANAYQPENGEPIPTVQAEIILQGFMVAAVTDDSGKTVDGMTTEVTFQPNGEPIATQKAGDALNAFVNQMNNNCQPEDKPFGCVNDPKKPSPLPGLSLWETTQDPEQAH